MVKFEKNKKLNALKKILGDPYTIKNNEAVFFCPKCNHRKAKLSINLLSDETHCWTCTNFSSKSLLKVLGIKKNKEYYDYKKSLGFNEKEEQEEKIHVYDTPYLPSEFRPLSVTHRSPYYSSAIRYLTNRGITADDILQWKLGYCEEGEYRYRIIIPSYDENGELNFFVGRSFFDGNVSYKHGNFSKDIIWNDIYIDWTKPVNITEGPFDAFVIKHNVIPLQGSSLSEKSILFKKIVDKKVDVYFALDKDAVKNQINIIKKFKEMGTNCFFIHCNKKDVGEMTNEQFLYAKSKCIHIKSDLDLLKIKVNNIK